MVISYGKFEFCFYLVWFYRFGIPKLKRNEHLEFVWMNKEEEFLYFLLLEDLFVEEGTERFSSTMFQSFDFGNP